MSREKGRDLTQSYDKSPYTNRNVKRAKLQHKQRHKKFDTAVSDRLRAVSWSNYGHPTGCEMKFLTWKTVFLVALATASRVSEIHALSLDSQHLRF